MVYIQCRLNCIFAALRVVVQAIDHGAVAVLQHGPTVGVLHVRPHPDAEQEHHIDKLHAEKVLVPDIPSSKCCIGKYLLGYPSSSCFLTHSSAD